MNKIKYNFWNSLLSMLVAYVIWVLFFVPTENHDLKSFLEFLMSMSLILAIPPALSLLFVPLIIWSFNKLFKLPKLFPLWTAFSAFFLLFSFFVCFTQMSAADSEKMNLVLIVKATLPMSLFFSPAVFAGGFVFGLTYLFLDNKFFSKEEPKS